MLPRTPITLTAGAALLLALTSGASAEASSKVLISQGHVDAVDVGYENGKLEITVHDESVTPDIERDPADVVLVAKKESQITVPDDPAFAFLGTPGVSKVWLLPEIQDENLLWPGLSTEELEPGIFRGDSVRIRAVAFQGPHGASLFTNGPSGEPQILADSEDSKPDFLDLPVGLHQHANWAFEKAGTYKITVVATATLANGRRLSSDPAVITFKAQS